MVGPPTEVPGSPTLVGSSDKESNNGVPKIQGDAQSVSTIGDGIVRHWNVFHLVMVLTVSAWCTNLDISTFHSHTE
jgi:hypothetical protein